MSANVELTPDEVQEEMGKIVEAVEEDRASESMSNGSSGSIASLFNFKLRPIKGGQKHGRNLPCPCGSKKKYKSCCLPKEMDEQKRKLEEIYKLQLQAKELKDGNDKKKSSEKQKEEKKSISSGAAKSQSTEGVGGN